jgi:acetyltransferase-like isoleucine patch superfamily enzyme
MRYLIGLNENNVPERPSHMEYLKISKYLIGLFALGRILLESGRLLVLRFLLGYDKIPGSIKLACGVRLRATDGALLKLGEGVSIDRFADITAKHGTLEIGARSYVGQFSVICARSAITIGVDCLIAEHVSIRDQDHRFGPDLTTAKAGFTSKAITIGDNVWIGSKTTITKGVRIGDNAVIGANSVVTRDIPANSVATGAPARVVRKTDFLP